ncbi:cytochrome c4 [Hydrogenophilus thermoluteolus]|nr:c-type cytochrome [Hydrogenophilus thermoluteolus]MBW7657395.1 cytochrome c4 [Hydrogenophilus thermoluteolus]
MKPLVVASSLLLVAGAAHAVEPARVQEIVTTLCAACHGTDGNSAVAEYPKLAGQHAEYLYKQLVEFKSWNGEPPKRENAIMNGMVATLTKEEMKAVAEYFSQQKPAENAAQNPATLALGQKIWRAGIASKGVPACAACHGPSGSGIPVQFPMLKGQHAQYTVAQLKAFREQQRANDPEAMMRMAVNAMTDSEMAAVADYIAGLR